MTVEVKGFLQQRGQKSEAEIEGKRTGLTTVWVTRREGAMQCHFSKNCHKVTLLKLEGLRMQTAASSYNERITITTKVRKAFKVGECSAAGRAIGESERENCFTTHSCTKAFLLYELIT